MGNKAEHGQRGDPGRCAAEHVHCGHGIADCSDAEASRSPAIARAGHDVRRCPIKGQKALPQGCSEVPAVRARFDDVVERGADLFEHVRAIGTEGIVSKRAGSHHTGGTTPEWCKSKCRNRPFCRHGFQELGPGRLEARHVAEDHNGEVVAVGQVRFGFAGKGLRAIVDLLRADRRLEAAGLCGSTGNRMHVATRHEDFG